MTFPTLAFEPIHDMRSMRKGSRGSTCTCVYKPHPAPSVPFDFSARNTETSIYRMQIEHVHGLLSPRTPTNTAICSPASRPESPTIFTPIFTLSKSTETLDRKPSIPYGWCVLTLKSPTMEILEMHCNAAPKSTHEIRMAVCL